MDIIEEIASALGADRVTLGDEMGPWLRDWTGAWPSTPLAVLRPRNTSEVSAMLARANAAGIPVVPVSGNTSVTGASQARGALVLSLDRMTAIREIRADSRLAVVEAGVVLQTLHQAVEAAGLSLPVSFGAQGSARIGGILGTNAGGSNVLRWGNARAHCLGIEAVLADGRVMNLMSALHKDNSGYDLRDLLIGSEGTLAVITAAVFRLQPGVRARATAMAALPDIPTALSLLNRLQEATGGQVDAFEYMPRSYFEGYLRVVKGARLPFAGVPEVGVLIELATSAARDAEAGPEGDVPLLDRLEEVLAGMMEEGAVLDAVVARSEAQRREIWARREAAAEIAFSRKPFVDTDIALPLHAIAPFFDRLGPRIAELDPGATDLAVGHLGDGNIHYTLYPTRSDPHLSEVLRAAIEAEAVTLGGSFSAEHGVGQIKRAAMAEHKDKVAVEMMRAIKRAFDPQGILNPGKVLPDPA